MLTAGWLVNSRSTYPIMRILVSNTLIMISLSNDTFLMTSCTACSNSSKSPSITRVSRESTRVIEKLKSESAIGIGSHLFPDPFLLSQYVVHIPTGRSNSAESSSAGQGHQFVRWPCIFQVRSICMIEHVPRLLPVKVGTIIAYTSTECALRTTYLRSYRSLSVILWCDSTAKQ